MFDVPEPFVTELVRLLTGRRVVALTGAGCSTESGIPDYRGPSSRTRGKTPIQYREFVNGERARRRYWARSMLGWPLFSRARPNSAHLALSRLERSGIVRGVITQNVDRLHHAAGSARLIELHGALAEVRCLACGALEARAELQARLEALNPGFCARHVESAPDGDAELDEALVDGFVPAVCVRCSGLLKPNVVFFGENVPKAVVAEAFELLGRAEVLLVLGSSLSVFSGFRFVREAVRRELPVVIVNQGPTRGDPLARLKIDARLGDFLPPLADRLAT